MDPLRARLEALCRDGTLDVEDIDHAVATALADGVLSPAEVDTFRAALVAFAGLLEPGARAFLEARVAGQPVRAPNRVLLAPHPRGDQPDLYYARADVVALQEALTALGQPTGVDGDYGPGTLRAVQGFQAGAGIPATGVVDSATLAALNEALSARGRPLLDLAPRDRIRPDTVIASRGRADPGVVRALEAALVGLSRQFGRPDWATADDGTFDRGTEAALAAFQGAAFLPRTGLYDTATRDALNEALGAAGLARLDHLPVPGEVRCELHFYPNEDERKVYVLQGGRVLDVYAMVGADRVGRDDPRNPHVDYDPTPAGTYEVVEVSPHASNAWPMSYIPYGAPLREVGGVVEFQDPAGRWRPATGPNGVFNDRNPPPLPREDYYQDDGTLMPTWRLNDFGHLRARLRDLRTGVLQGHMIHSSPENELTPRYYADTREWLAASTALAELRYSHGCEHIHPRDFDQMVARGYLAPGARFVVHGYDERFGGGAAVA